MDVFRLRCPLSWMSFVFDALCLGCLSSSMPFVSDAGRRRSLGPRRCASCAALPLSWGARAPLAPNARGEPPRHVLTAAEVKATIGAVGSSAWLGPASAAAPSAPHPRCGLPQGRWRWSGAGGVRSWSVCLGLYVLVCMSWSVCLGLYVLVCMFWSACFGLYVLACMSWPVCLGVAALVLPSWHSCASTGFAGA